MPNSRRARAAAPTGATPTAGALAPPAVRVVTYRRASTDEGNQPYSLDAQEQRLAAYIASQPDWTRTADYVERASGKDIDGRPQLRKLLKDAGAGRFDVVLVVRVDRWSRSLVDLLDTVATLDRHGVAFHSATEHFDTGTPMGKLLLQMLGMFAEFERSMIIDRIERGNAAKLAKGIPLTRRVGYGLTVEPGTGRLAADPDTIGIVRRIFREYTHDRKGTKAIAQALTADGIPGPGAVGWSPDSVSRVLRNRAFIGQLRYRDTWLDGAHEPIIDIDTFTTAQTLADKRSSYQQASARRRGDFLLSGVIRCARCSSAYVGTSGTSAAGTVSRYYSCGTARRYGAARCDGPSIPAGELEELVTADLLAAYADSALFDEAIAVALADHAQRHEPVAEELAAVTAALTQKERVRQRYQDDYEAGKLAAERYEARAGQLDTELAGLRARTVELQLELERPDVPGTPTGEQLQVLRDQLADRFRTGDIALRKTLYTALIARLEVHDVDDIRATYRLYDPASAAIAPGG